MAATGRRIILPDLRGHGQSEAPTSPAAYPKDALPQDQEVLLAQLGMTDFDLVGYSLGARTAVRMLARGHSRPANVFLGGMGEAGITTVGTRKDYFEDGIKNGPNAKDARAGAYIQTILKQRGMSPEAALGVLSTQVSTSREVLTTIKTPVLVVNGDQDRDNGDPMALAAALGNATCQLVPGNHLSAVAEPAFRDALSRPTILLAQAGVSRGALRASAKPISPLDAPSCVNTLEHGPCEGIACGKRPRAESHRGCTLLPEGRGAGARG
eukprot:gene13678-18354_t